MNEQKLNKKLAEWAGLKQVPRYDGTDMSNPLWLYPDGNHDNLCPGFTQSLDACFKWLVPKVICKEFAKEDKMGEQTSTEHEYSVQRVCSNCGHAWREFIEKGIKASSAVICPNCECYTGH